MVILDSKRRHYVARVSIFLVTVALVVGMAGCGGTTPHLQYNLTISSTEGGSVTTPGEGTFARYAGRVVDLVATADVGYHFLNWTGDVDAIADVNAPSTNITMNGDYDITANFVAVYDLTIASTAGGSVTTSGDDEFGSDR